MTSPYETDALLGQYLLLHYGKQEEVMPYEDGPLKALHFPLRCAQELIRASGVTEHARALDLGCAVGRSTFELARYAKEAVGIDFSHAFIKAASRLQKDGVLPYTRADEGELGTPLLAQVAPEIDRTRVRFETGDACALAPGHGTFDLILLANLIDRVRLPSLLLGQLPELVRPGGTVGITSPYTWMEEFTPRAEWLGGHDGKKSFDGLRARMEPAFELISRKDLPFLIREHARKFQWSVAEASFWRRR
jgi:putative 4-mercaptohistidine N1-methyltranferase